YVVSPANDDEMKNVVREANAWCQQAMVVESVARSAMEQISELFLIVLFCEFKTPPEPGQLDLVAVDAEDVDSLGRGRGRLGWWQRTMTEDVDGLVAGDHIHA
ncbi:hypothetical protein THAOC_37445, partial [Thalassiosira oceanica]